MGKKERKERKEERKWEGGRKERKEGWKEEIRKGKNIGSKRFR